MLSNTTEVTEEDIGKVLSGMLRAFEAEYVSMSEDELESKWHFKFDKDHSLEWNLYQFLSLITLYSGSCRRWEEMHNGSSCVVERVRDKYTMPKIREFADQIRSMPPSP